MAVLLAVLCSLSVICSCRGGGSNWGGTIETRDGIRIVKNPVDPLYEKPPVSLEEDLAIGADGEKGDGLFFRTVLTSNSLDVDRSGNIYILDTEGCTIAVVDSQGRYIRNIGRNGQGPGEFQYPMCLKVLPDDKIAVYDGSNLRMSFFEFSGRLSYEISLAVHSPLFTPQIDSRGQVFGLAPGREGADRTWELLKISADGKTISQIIRSATRVSLDANKINLFMTRLDFRLTPQDEIVWGDQKDYVLNVADNAGRLKAIIYREYVPLAITKKDIDARLDVMYGGDPRPTGVKAVAPSSFPPFNMLLVADDGRIFVRTRERTAEGIGYSFDVFDGQGVFLYRMGFKGTPLLISRDRLYALEEDEEGIVLIKRYVLK